MKNLSKNEKLLLIGLGFLIVLVAYYQFLLTPLLDNIIDTKYQIEENRTTFNKLELMEKSNKAMKKSIEELKEKYEAFKKSLPIELRDPEIQSFLNSSAEAFNVKILSTAYGEAVDVSLGNDKKNNESKNESKNEKGQLKLVPVTVNMEGSYLDIMKYIYHLEHFEKEENDDSVSELSIDVPDTAKNNIRINEVKSINVAKKMSSDGGEVGDKVSAALVINYYYVTGDEEDKKNMDYEINIPVGTGNDLFN
ncbi:MAG: hypothetical protein GX895_03940 [Clostridiales bacterium]|uniref:hypothetical protein n=1 Tax=Clostridium sp. N3C TaxID=1776758 RepID=UPI00092E1898|nr:hypothetical protein [Clostridium sp. N3C]NLZ47931.1 hypothetical protein [Clostridiales bacterium]SCN22485.1 hypothetical protein N3C_0813 [Clostridium sp. N3C]